MIRTVVITAVMALMAGCAEVQEATDNLARDGARAAVDEVLVTRFPGIDGTRVTPYTDCVIDNASGREIASLARAALVGVDEATVSLVLDITGRPETTACFVRAAAKV